MSVLINKDMSENKLCTVSKIFTEFCNPTPRACGRGGATSGAVHIHWSVRVGARRTLSEQSARPSTQLRHSGTGFVSIQFNEPQHSSQNTQTFYVSFRSALSKGFRFRL